MKKITLIVLALLILLTSCALPTNIDTNVDDTNTDVEKQTYDIIKDEKITNAQREKFFEFVIEHRIDAMPEFESGTTPDVDSIIYTYVVNLCKDEIAYHTVNGNYTPAMPVSTVKRVAKEKFGLTLDLSEYDTVIPLKASGLMGEPMCELVYYTEEETEGGTLITARVAYYYTEFYYLDNPEIRKPEEYKTAKQKIITGKADSSLLHMFIHFQFIVDKDGELVRFVSLTDEIKGPDGFTRFVNN